MVAMFLQNGKLLSNNPAFDVPGEKTSALVRLFSHWPRGYLTSWCTAERTEASSSSGVLFLAATNCTDRITLRILPKRHRDIPLMGNCQPWTPTVKGGKWPWRCHLLRRKRRERCGVAHDHKKPEKHWRHAEPQAGHGQLSWSKSMAPCRFFSSPSSPTLNNNHWEHKTIVNDSYKQQYNDKQCDGK